MHRCEHVQDIVDVQCSNVFERVRIEGEEGEGPEDKGILYLRTACVGVEMRLFQLCALCGCFRLVVVSDGTLTLTSFVDTACVPPSAVALARTVFIYKCERWSGHTDIPLKFLPDVPARARASLLDGSQYIY